MTPEEPEIKVLRINRNLGIHEIGELLEKSRAESRILEISESEARAIRVCVRRSDEPSINPEECLSKLLQEAVQDPTSIEWFSEQELDIVRKFNIKRRPTLTELTRAIIDHDRRASGPKMHVVGGFGGITDEQIRNEAGR
jgi:hypothetical protein